MKPLVADEMFPEGIDIEEVSIQLVFSDIQEKDELFTFIKSFVCPSLFFSQAILG